MNTVAQLLTNATDGQVTPDETQSATAGTPDDRPSGNLREVAAAEISAFFVDAPRPDSEWRQTIASVREMLAALERACEAAEETFKQKRAEAAAWVSTLVENLLNAATAEATAAIDRTRAEAEARLVQMQALVTDLHAQAEHHREEISDLRQRLETAKARNEKLTAAFNTIQAAFDTVQRSVALLESGDPTSGAAGQTQPATQAEAAAPPADAQAQPAEKTSTLSPDVAGLTTRSTVPAPVIGPRQDQLANKTAAAESDPALTEYVKNLLDQIESIYWTDLRTAMGPSDIVGRLTENLRYARDVFGRRADSANSSQTTIFEQQLTSLLDSKSDTSFGRHLAIAAYSYARPDARRAKTD